MRKFYTFILLIALLSVNNRIYAQNKLTASVAGEIPQTPQAAGVSKMKVDIIKYEFGAEDRALVHIKVTPNSETVKHHTAVFLGEPAKQAGIEYCLKLTKSDGEEREGEHTFTWPVHTNTEYLVISIGKNADGQWGDYTSMYFTVPDPTSGLTQSHTSEEMSIFPVPNNGNFTVNIDNVAGKGKIEIFNPSGSLVHSQAVEGNSAQIRLTDIAQGLYIVRYTNGKKNIVSRVLIK